MKEYIFNPLFVIFLLTVIAAFFVWINSVKDTKIRDAINSGVTLLKENADETINRLTKANNDISLSLKKTDSANQKLADTYDKLTENYQKTIEAKEAVIAAQKDIINQITGGDSYCVLNVNFQEGIPIFSLLNAGKIPIKDINISIVDFVKRQRLMKQYASDLQNRLPEISYNTSYHFQFASLNASSVIQNLQIPIEQDQDEIFLRIEFSQSNGFFLETLNVKNFKNGKLSYKMELRKGDKILEQRN